MREYRIKYTVKIAKNVFENRRCTVLSKTAKDAIIELEKIDTDYVSITIEPLDKIS